MPIKRTLTETYYAINAALIAALLANYISCEFYKYGIDPVTLADVENTDDVKYPYFQSYLSNVKQNSRTSKESGVLTNFDYQISFFTAPVDEFEEDTDALIPYEIVKVFLMDIQLNILGDIVTVLEIQEVPEFEFKAGVSVAKRILIVKMQAICAYPTINIPDPTESTDIDSAININQA